MPSFMPAQALLELCIHVTSQPNSGAIAAVVAASGYGSELVSDLQVIPQVLDCRCRHRGVKVTSYTVSGAVCRAGRDDLYDDDRYGPTGGFGRPDFDERYGPGGPRYGPAPDRYGSYEYEDRERRGYGPEDADYRAGWREREAAYAGGYRGEGARPGYEPRGGFDRERYEVHRPGYDAAYMDRDLLPPPPPPRPAAAGPPSPEPAAAAAAGGSAGGAPPADESDSDVDPEREAFEAELARVAADMERVSPVVWMPYDPVHAACITFPAGYNPIEPKFWSFGSP